MNKNLKYIFVLAASLSLSFNVYATETATENMEVTETVPEMTNSKCKVNFDVVFADGLNESEVPGVSISADIIEKELLYDMSGGIPDGIPAEWFNTTNTSPQSEKSDFGDEGDPGEDTIYSTTASDINNWSCSMETDDTTILMLNTSLPNTYSNRFIFKLEGDCINIDLTEKTVGVFDGNRVLIKTDRTKEQNVTVYVSTNENTIFSDLNEVSINEEDSKIVSEIFNESEPYVESDKTFIITDEDRKVVEEAKKEYENNERLKRNKIIVLVIAGGLIILVGGTTIWYRRYKKRIEDD